MLVCQVLLDLLEHSRHKLWLDSQKDDLAVLCNLHDPQKLVTILRSQDCATNAIEIQANPETCLAPEVL